MTFLYISAMLVLPFPSVMMDDAPLVAETPKIEIEGARIEKPRKDVCTPKKKEKPDTAGKDVKKNKPRKPAKS